MPGAHIGAGATAVPDTRVTQKDAREYSRRFFKGRLRSLDRLLPVFENADIDSRYLSVPKAWFDSPKTLEEKNHTYIRVATDLSKTVSLRALAKAGVDPEDVHQVLFVSSTGFATPSIDARLVNELGLNRHVMRSPLWGLGCGGGAMGLSHAFRYLLGNPTHKVLLIAVELCSLTFHFGDYSKSNLIALALFADGAAGVVLGGEESGLDPVATIETTRSTTWPDSLDVMGWNFLNEGMQVVFARGIPAIVREKSEENIDSFLHDAGATREDIDHWIVHPGGLKVIEAYKEALSLRPRAMATTRRVLRDYGNMSSATVLFVLEACLRNGTQPGDLGLLTALGPGFSAENLLLSF
jgi:alkylresorcinol/alkylpyrone synthase